MADLEEIYASRLVLETFAARATVPRLSKADIDGMDAALEIMRLGAAGKDYDSWEVSHHQFHSILMSGAGSRITLQVHQLAEHAERYRRVYTTQTPTAWDASLDQDTRLLEAIRMVDVETVAEGLATHLAGTALAMIAMLDPRHEPQLIRAALHHVRIDDKSGD